MLTDPQERAVAGLVAAFAGRRPVRAGSFIVTLYGDAIAPRGGEAWLASLLPLLDSVGLNGSQVRTAVSRLAAEGWLDRHRSGRRSAYALSPSGRERFDRATRRIYAAGVQPAWDGGWTVAVLPGERERARRELAWLGFGALAPNAMIHPAPDRPAVDALVAGWPAAERPLLIAGTDPGAPPDVLAGLAASCWDLDGLAARYRGFVERYAALDDALAGGVRLSPLACLQARLLLIHDYRRPTLRDPMLPPALLPPGWAGGAAARLATRLYGALVPGAEAWIDRHVACRGGPLPAPDAAFRRRFGGLERVTETD